MAKKKGTDKFTTEDIRGYLSAFCTDLFYRLRKGGVEDEKLLRETIWHEKQMFLERMNLEETASPKKISNGWMDERSCKPPLIDGENYSDIVWGWDGELVMPVSYALDPSPKWRMAVVNLYVEIEENKIKAWSEINYPYPPCAL